ncbi:hypothetical protein I7I48_04725 [Histoplasma ohiense]|nr:hypothetical protein I7I48_04725 [Histoplasma ohiense (nom. inval.)]
MVVFKSMLNPVQISRSTIDEYSVMFSNGSATINCKHFHAVHGCPSKILQLDKGPCSDQPALADQGFHTCSK